MPLIIQTVITPAGAPSLVTPARLATLMTAAGRSIPAGGGTVVGFTRPRIIVNQTRLQYHTRNSRTQFRFNTGTLMLTLHNEIFLINTLSPCARSIWLQHEQKHVRDNGQIMGRMDRELRADTAFAAILVNPTVWRPIGNFNPTQTEITARSGAVFARLTQHSANHTDTLAEYRRVERQIRVRCGGRIANILKQGMYGHGIDLVQIALNNHPPTALPPLVPDGIYGAKTTARVVEYQTNNHPPLDIDGDVGPNTKASLGV